MGNKVVPVNGKQVVALKEGYELPISQYETSSGDIRVHPSVPIPIDAERLPHLKDRELIFLEEVTKGVTPSRAYRTAYPNSSVATSAVESTRLMHRPHIQVWLAAFREARMATYLDNAQGYVAELRDCLEKAKRTGNLSAASRFMELIGKTEGHFDRQVVSIEQRDDGDLIKRVELTLGPVAAEAARKRLGINPT